MRQSFFIGARRIEASIYRHGISILWYLTVFSLIMLVGAAVYLIGRRAHR